MTDSPPRLAPPLPPMEAKLVDALPEGEGWQFEPKWDGFRCLVFRDGGEVALQSKAGKPLGRYFPGGGRAGPRRCRPDRFVLDGELVIRSAACLSFEALQMRLHPAESRIRKLAARNAGAADAVRLPGAGREAGCSIAPLAERRAALEAFHRRRGAATICCCRPARSTAAAASAWLDAAGGALDGVVAKRLDEPYRPASGRCSRSSSCAPPTASSAASAMRRSERQVGSLLLGLYDDAGKLDHVGFTSAIPAGGEAGADRAARGAGRAARLHRRRARRAEPLEHRALRRTGSRCGPSWSPRCATTMSPATASATAPNSCAGGPTRRRRNAGWTSSARRPRRRRCRPIWAARS